MELTTHVDLSHLGSCLSSHSALSPTSQLSKIPQQQQHNDAFLEDLVNKLLTAEHHRHEKEMMEQLKERERSLSRRLYEHYAPMLKANPPITTTTTSSPPIVGVPSSLSVVDGKRNEPIANTGPLGLAAIRDIFSAGTKNIVLPTSTTGQSQAEVVTNEREGVFTVANSLPHFSPSPKPLFFDRGGGGGGGKKEEALNHVNTLFAAPKESAPSVASLPLLFYLSKTPKEQLALLQQLQQNNNSGLKMANRTKPCHCASCKSISALLAHPTSTTTVAAKEHQITGANINLETITNNSNTVKIPMIEPKPCYAAKKTLFAMHPHYTEFANLATSEHQRQPPQLQPGSASPTANLLPRSLAGSGATTSAKVPPKGGHRPYNYECNECHKLFRFKSNLFEHRSLHEKWESRGQGNNAARRNECPYCQKLCRLKGNLKKHLQTHVKDERELEALWAAKFKRRSGRPRKEPNGEQQDGGHIN